MSDPKIFHDGRVVLYAGDCLDILSGLPAESVDSVVTDPPYHLTSIVRRFGGENAAPARDYSGERADATGAYARASRGFMGKAWDGGDIAFRRELWAQVFRVLKPGGHVLAFSATRTYHRMACAIEDAGFEIRDMIADFVRGDGAVEAFMESLSPEQAGAFVRMLEDSDFGGMLAWLYGSGFPKSHDVSKAIDKALGAERARVRVDASAVRNPKAPGAGRDGAEGATRPWIEAALARGYHEAVSDEAVSDEAVSWRGWGTALKPALEPICCARKPLAGTVVANVLAHGVGALNIDACRVGYVDAGDRASAAAAAAAQRSRQTSRNVEGWGMSAQDLSPEDFMSGGAGRGRWPANVVHDGSPEVVAAFPDSEGQRAAVGPRHGAKSSVNCYGDYGRRQEFAPRGDSGSAARFFYSAKADAGDRLGSRHPTVKPLDLMRWLVRLITPPHGLVLDPFAGTGTTAAAALLEGMSCWLCEREAEYRGDIARRMDMVFAGAVERAATKPQAAVEDLPLFGGADDAPRGGAGPPRLRRFRRRSHGKARLNELASARPVFRHWQFLAWTGEGRHLPHRRIL